jgi:hypothetical protein
MRIYENRQAALEEIRSEADELVRARWISYYSNLSFEDVDQLLNGRHPHGHKIIQDQTPESQAAATVWRNKSKDSRAVHHGRSVNLQTLDVDGVTQDHWWSKPIE